MKKPTTKPQPKPTKATKAERDQLVADIVAKVKAARKARRS